MAELPVALSIAALDPSGGAGLGADLRTFAAERVWGSAVITAVTYQSGARLTGRLQLEPDAVMSQLEVLMDDVSVGAAKIGMVGSPAVARAVGDSFYKSRTLPRPAALVVDPVLATSRGESLASDGTSDAIVDSLLPFATIAVPNLDETGVILGKRPAAVDEMSDAAREIAALGPTAVLVTGGDIGEEVFDVLWYEGRIEVFGARRIESDSTHGTGCVLSASIAAGLAKGMEIPDAVVAARERVRAGLQARLEIGRGRGPVEPMSL